MNKEVYMYMRNTCNTVCVVTAKLSLAVGGLPKPTVHREHPTGTLCILRIVILCMCPESTGPLPVCNKVSSHIKALLTILCLSQLNCLGNSVGKLYIA